jgi:hypothetical protein
MDSADTAGKEALWAGFRWPVPGLLWADWLAPSNRHQRQQFTPGCVNDQLRGMLTQLVKLRMESMWGPEPRPDFCQFL